MDKTKKEKLLASYMRRNKVAREKMAQNAGFDTGDEFKKHLQEGIAKEKAKLTSQPVIPEKNESQKDLMIHNVHIIDASSSMSLQGRLKSALKGVNEGVSELKKDNDVNYIHSLVSFSSSKDVKFHEFRTPIKLVPKLSFNARSLTALYEAIVVTLDKIMESIPKKSNEKTIVKIFTDGGENASPKQYHDSVREVIKKAENSGITVTFVGTKHDVENVKNRLSIDSSNTLVHDNTSEGISKSFKISSQATKSYVSKAMTGEDVSLGFYKDLK